jgi:hypothetical protein
MDTATDMDLRSELKAPLCPIVHNVLLPVVYSRRQFKGSKDLRPN